MLEDFYLEFSQKCNYNKGEVLQKGFLEDSVRGSRIWPSIMCNFLFLQVLEKNERLLRLHIPPSVLVQPWFIDMSINLQMYGHVRCLAPRT